MGKNKGRVIDICYWGLIFCSAVFLTIKELAPEFIKVANKINVEMFINMIPSILLFFVIALVFGVGVHFYFTIPYFAIKIAKKTHRMDKLDETDFKKNGYYRQLIPQFSAAALSYIDDFALGEKDVVATLLALELKDKIKINNKIEIINKNDGNLTKNEIYIFNELKNNNLKNVDMSIFEKEVLADCENSGLLLKSETTKKKKQKIVIVNILIYILLVVLFEMFEIALPVINSASNIVIIICAIVMFLITIFKWIYPFIMGISIVVYLMMRMKNPYERTSKAKEINTKLKGLKKYIKDFSLMEKKKKDDLVIWEQYLIYSVILGVNTKIIDEIFEKV